MRNLISDVKARLLAGSGERRLKIGFVGCGEHARTNLYPVLPGLRVDLMAICARRLERAQRAARDFGASAAYDDFQEMFTKEPLDAVIICVNAREHFRMCEAALEKGLHVFLEKPATRSIEEAERLQELERASGKRVMVGFMKRFAPAYLRAKEIAHSPSFGPLSSIDMKLCVGPFPGEDEFLIEVAIHHIDLARFLAGEVESLHVEKHGSGKGAVTFAIVARFESGAVGTLRFSTEQSWRATNERVELSGAGQFVVVDNVISLKHYHGAVSGSPHSGGGHSFWEPNHTVPIAQNQAAHLNGFGLEIAHFVDQVLSGRAPAPGLSDHVRALRVLQMISASVTQGSRP